MTASGFARSEEPAILGGPYTPTHTVRRRIGYLATGVTIALLGTFGNGLVTTKLSAVAGEYGMASAEANWLVVAYTGMSAGAALFVIKGRQQFGIDRIVKCCSPCMRRARCSNPPAPGVTTAIVARAANGLATSTGVTMAVYHSMETLSPARRPVAVIVVLGPVQVSGPLASARASLEGRRAALGSARAQHRDTSTELARADDLITDGSVSGRERDQAEANNRQTLAAVRQAKAEVGMAVENVRSVQVGRGGLQAQVAQARALLDTARIDLAHTRIAAPVDGQLGEVSVRLGPYVANGTQLFSLVPAARWVNANYKEPPRATSASAST